MATPGNNYQVNYYSESIFTKSVRWGVTSKSYQAADILMFVMKNCFLLCVIGLIIACIICCRVNVTLDMILGGEDILVIGLL